MIKVRFNNSMYGNSKKVEYFNNKISVVYLSGEIRFLDIPGHFIPREVEEWIQKQSIVKVLDLCSILRITSKGEAIRNMEDEFSAVKGERIAEGRAKIKLYKFMKEFLNRLYNHYSQILYGNARFIPDTDEGLWADMYKYAEFLEKEKQHLNELIDMT